MYISSILALVSFFITIVHLYLGIYALKLDPKAKLNRIFFCLCLSFAIWTFANTCGYLASTDEINWLTNRIGALGYCTFAGLMLHFFLILTNQEAKHKKFWLYILLYLPGILFIYQSVTGILTVKEFFPTPSGIRGVIVPSESIWFWCYNLYYMSYVIIGTFLVYRWGKKSVISREKKQALVITVTALLTLVLCSVNEMILPALHIYLFPGISVILILLWVWSIWYTMVKYKLMNLTSEMVAEEILTKVKDLIILVKPDGKIVRINQQVEKTLSYSNPECINADLQKIMDTKNNELFNYIQAENHLNSDLSCELSFRAANGSAIPVQVSISTIKDVAGDLIGYVIIGQDLRPTKQLQQEIMERREIEKALRDSYEKLHELDQMKTDFLSTVSHELRTPLTSIIGFAKIIKKKLQTTNREYQLEHQKTNNVLNQIAENIDIIVSEGERLTSLINDVLDIAKMEAGKVEWRMEPVAVLDFVERAIGASKALFLQKGLTLSTQVEPDLPKVIGDRDRLIQVVINLLSNAAKFTEKGSVVCKAMKIGSEIVISVTDSGIGIAESDQKQVFEKFKQVGDTMVNKPKGTGLGLPICKQIIEQHRGRIWVESELGKGCKFSFALPVISAISISNINGIDTLVNMLRERLAVDVLTSSTSKKQILVVDDDSSIRKLLVQAIEAEGYLVREAHDGLDALVKIKNELPDLVILDVMMPNLNGFEVAAILKNDPMTLQLPIIILSIIEDKKRGYKLGINKYFSKPVNMDEFIPAVEELLNQGWTRKRILIIDEGESTGGTLFTVLKGKGFNEVAVCGGEECIQKALEIKPELIIVDQLIYEKYAIYSALRSEKDSENILFYLLAEGRVHAPNQA